MRFLLLLRHVFLCLSVCGTYTLAEANENAVANQAGRFADSVSNDKTSEKAGSDPAQIHAGSLAGPSDNPFQVALLVKAASNGKDRFFCGGTLINRNYIVTAAHCSIIKSEHRSDVMRPDEVEVLAGTRSLSTGGVRRNIVSIVRHPKFDLTTYHYDVAILKLQQPIDGIPFAQLPVSDGVPGTMLLVTGWGITSQSDADIPDSLQKISVPTVSNRTCTARHGHLPSAVLCAGFRDGGRGICRGDSGGPATQGQQNMVLTGIVSSYFGNCTDPGNYDLFTRVSDPEIKDFILNNIR